MVGIKGDGQQDSSVLPKQIISALDKRKYIAFSNALTGRLTASNVSQVAQEILDRSDHNFFPYFFNKIREESLPIPSLTILVGLGRAIAAKNELFAYDTASTIRNQGVLFSAKFLYYAALETTSVVTRSLLEWGIYCLKYSYYTLKIWDHPLNILYYMAEFDEQPSFRSKVRKALQPFFQALTSSAGLDCLFLAAASCSALWLYRGDSSSHDNLDAESTTGFTFVAQALYAAGVCSSFVSRYESEDKNNGPAKAL